MSSVAFASETSCASLTVDLSKKRTSENQCTVNSSDDYTGSVPSSARAAANERNDRSPLFVSYL